MPSFYYPILQIVIKQEFQIFGTCNNRFNDCGTHNISHILTLTKLNAHNTKWLIVMRSPKQIALKRVHILFRLAKEVIHENPERAQRYVQIARRIAMRTRLRMPKEYRSLICRKCKSFILPGVNCRIRIQPRRESHMVITCLNCGGHSRIPLKGEKKSC